MKVIFLDIDGVLNSVESAMALGGYPYLLDQIELFDNVALGLIQRLVRQTGAKVVISSTWRKTHDVAEFEPALVIPVIGKTCNSRSGRRGEEIAVYLEGNPQIENYVIIDDDSDMLECQLDNFVKTSGLVGFTIHDYTKACRVLGTPDTQIEYYINACNNLKGSQ
jgi:hypothetical protein